MQVKGVGGGAGVWYVCEGEEVVWGGEGWGWGCRRETPPPQVSAELLEVLLQLLRLDVTPQGLIAFLRSVKDAKVGRTHPCKSSRVSPPLRTSPHWVSDAL